MSFFSAGNQSMRAQNVPAVPFCLSVSSRGGSGEPLGPRCTDCALDELELHNAVVVAEVNHCWEARTVMTSSTCYTHYIFAIGKNAYILDAFFCFARS